MYQRTFWCSFWKIFGRILSLKILQKFEENFWSFGNIFSNINNIDILNLRKCVLKNVYRKFLGNFSEDKKKFINFGKVFKYWKMEKSRKKCIMLKRNSENMGKLWENLEVFVISKTLKVFAKILDNFVFRKLGRNFATLVKKILWNLKRNVK